MSIVLDEHRRYLADRVRVDAFRSALQAVVRPGDVVLDLACGTGILGFLACDAGASRVYAVDEGPIIETARRFAAANGYADRVTCIRALSTRATLPEPVDVVVCDQVGNLGIEAGLFECLHDARRRFLKPGGRVVPSAVTFVMAPVESDDLRGRLRFWTTRPAGLDASCALTSATNSSHPCSLDGSQLLSPPALLVTSALPPADVRPIRGRAVCTIGRAGLVDGVGAWFRAELAPGISMTNEPGDPSRIDRGNVILPVHPPVPVDAGDCVGVEVSMLAPDAIVSWRVTVQRRTGSGEPVHASSHSTFHGMLVSKEDLARTRPESRPVLTRAGEARRAVLELCDGRRTLQDVERIVYARHPDLFASLHEAAALVAEVVTRECTADAVVPDCEPADR